jgi:hypothetical protein
MIIDSVSKPSPTGTTDHKFTFPFYAGEGHKLTFFTLSRHHLVKHSCVIGKNPYAVLGKNPHDRLLQAIYNEVQ